MHMELIADYACHTGEGPLWHPLQKRLYWVDIPAGRLFRYDPATGEDEQCLEADEAIGGFTVQANGDLLLFMARGAVRTWRDGFRDTIIEEIPAERNSRFNDVIADPRGRVFCGTMAGPDKPGTLYRLDVDGTLKVILEGLGCPNGMGFTGDRKRMYFTDSGAHTIWLFDYDEATGEITNQRPFAVLTAEEGFPDGMTVDAEDHVWSARWDGGCAVRYSPDGQVVQRFDFPAPKVSSVTFGGADYRDLYVTTAGGSSKSSDGTEAGALFRLAGAGRGREEFYSRVG
ncbi:SMP-30/gluconolactonase/LRE family protein [bacterium]|nr:SMP-30/gluconolactonase/LRE family protein [bacterium]